MNVADAMTPRSDVVFAEVPGTRDDVLAHFQERRFSSVPVVNKTDGEETFRGLVTREALISTPDEDQLALLVEEVPTIGPEATVAELAGLVLETKERRIPVLDGEEFVGIVTVTDIVRAIAQGDADGETPIDDLYSETVNTVYAETPLPIAERELSYSGVPYGVVLGDDGDPVGMLTEVDIIEIARVVQGEDDPGDALADQDDDWMWEGIKAVGSRPVPTMNVEIPSSPVSEIMTADLITVSRQKTAREAAQLMISNDIEQTPVIEGGELTGIVRDIDLLEGI